MVDLVIRTVAPVELGRVQAMASGWGYSYSTNPGDAIFLAEEAGQGLGMVRRTCEEGVFMLRTMLVAPEARGRGVGTRLLEAFVRHLEGRECYCVPYRHLIDFYERGGFAQERSKNAPTFLGERLASYRSEELDVVLMRRPPQ